MKFLLFLCAQLWLAVCYFGMTTQLPLFYYLTLAVGLCVLYKPERSKQ